jgi:hypothetical protein
MQATDLMLPAEIEQEAPASGDPQRSSRSRIPIWARFESIVRRASSPLTGHISPLVGVVSAMVGVITAIVNVCVAISEPDVHLTVAPFIRVSQQSNGAFFYVQTGLYHSGRVPRPETVTNMRLKVQKETAAPVCFRWFEIASFTAERPGEEPKYRHVSEVVPVVVALGTPQSVFALFQGPPGWQFESAITYHVTLEADRASTPSEPLRAGFRFSLTQDDVRSIAPANNYAQRVESPADTPPRQQGDGLRGCSSCSRGGRGGAAGLTDD